MSVIDTASRVLREEAAAVLGLQKKLDDSFEMAVNMIASARGRVILTGMGKSGHIARKVAATMASTGTPAFFMHPAEAIHGDLGMVTSEDVVIAYSNSGETAEVINILPSIRRIGANLIAILHTGGKRRCGTGLRRRKGSGQSGIGTYQLYHSSTGHGGCPGCVPDGAP